MNGGEGQLELPLAQVVDLREAQRIQNTFSLATGFASMMVDKTGIPLTQASNFRPICALIRSTERGRARCASCDVAGGYAAHSSGKVHTYVCDNGLVDVAAPISVGGTYLGGIYCGQVLPTERRDELIEEILRRNEYLGLPREELLALARRIPVLPYERIQAAAELLQLMAEQIVQRGMERLEQTGRAQTAGQLTGSQEMIQLQQSLLNAHFLFNSLSLVSSSALAEGASRTEEIAYCLSEMLRYSVRNMARMVPLEQELEVVQHYLRLQQIRLSARLRVEITVDPALHLLRIPCMILQPLVENAIVHGVEPISRPVTLQVRAYQWLEGLMIQVCDDGAGVDPTVAARINARQGSGRPGRGLGLGTVITRLETEYGRRCAVRLEGGPGYGTQVMVYLPLQAAQE